MTTKEEHSELTPKEGSSELTQGEPCEGTFEKVPRELTPSYEASGQDSEMETYVTEKQPEGRSEKEPSTCTQSIGQMSLQKNDAGELFVKMPSGKKITLEVDSRDTIMDVKRKIQDEEGIPPAEQILSYYGKQLEGPHTLLAYNIRYKSQLQLALKRPSLIQIHVKTITGNRITFNVKSDDTIGIIKRKIQEMDRQHPVEVRLTGNGKDLRDDLTLMDYFIDTGHTLELEEIVV